MTKLSKRCYSSNGRVFFAFLGIGFNQMFWATQGYGNLDVLPWFRIRKWQSWVKDAIRRVLCEIGGLVETFRFWDEYYYEYEIYSIVNSAYAWTSVILAGKHDCRRHSTKSFSENVVVTETSFKVLEVLSFCRREIASHADVLTGSSRNHSSPTWGRNAWRTPKNVCVGG